MGKFVIRNTKTGVKFDLKAGNGEVIATSEVYASQAACKNGVESVRKNAPVAAVEDQTVEGFAVEKHPKFEIYTDKAGEFRFRLKATNGQIIAVSEGGFENGMSREQAEKLLASVTQDKSLMEQFRKEPVKAVEKVLGVDLPDEAVEKIITAVKAKIAADGAKDVLGSLKKLF